MELHTTIVIILILIILFYIIFIGKKKEIQLDKPYYDVSEIDPSLTLNSIIPIHNDIVNEINYVNTHNLKDLWTNWPEKELYMTPNNKWDIIPLCGFGVWLDNVCKLFPILTKFLRSVKNIKLAILSKLSAGMILKSHRGWAKHSNHVLRCHYGLIVPDECYVVVDGIKKKHAEKKWIIFDDSKSHHAENNGNSDRMVLIIDVERPKWVKTGTSDVAYSSELENVLSYFRNINDVIS